MWQQENTERAKKERDAEAAENALLTFVTSGIAENSQSSGQQSDGQDMQVILDVIPETAMSADLDQAIRHLLCECFPADRASFSQCRAWHDSWPAYTVVARCQDRLIGHVGMVVRSIQVGPSRVCVAGVQSFCIAPSHRGSGLSQKLLERALLEGRERGIPFGLLFCVPELERLYAKFGWHTVDELFTMRDEHGQPAPIPGKNIAMLVELSASHFPVGPIDLQGRDW